MNVYTELKPFIEYIQSIRKIEEYFSIDLLLPSKWSIPKRMVDETKLVSFETGDAAFKGISFISKLDQELNETFSRIEDIIFYNKEREMKESLFRQKVDQLKETFENTELEKLKNLYFKFDENSLIEDSDLDKLENDFEDEHEGKDVELVRE